MGAQLVGRAFAFASTTSLKPNEYRLLFWMALTALDADQPPRYFAAREYSAFGLGRRVADTPDPLDPDRDIKERERAAAFHAVKIAVQGLVNAGAIERLRRGREGTRAEFALTFKGTESLPLEGTSFLPLSGTESLPPRVGNPYPQGTTDEPQRKTPRETARSQAPHFQPVENFEGATNV